MTTNSNPLVTIQGIDNLTKEKSLISDRIKEVGFCIIRGLLNPQDITQQHALLQKSFDPKKDVRRCGPITERMPNFQRIDLGLYATVNARFCRIISNFFWNPDGLFSASFHTLQKIRDTLVDRHIDYKNGQYELHGKGFYEFPKIMQYPSGGGFLNEHFDGYNNDGIFNIGVSVTKRGVHFQKGGIYYKYRDGKECPLEDIMEPGDIYIHDSEAVHGVQPVDPDANIDITTMSGRVSLILSSESFPKPK